MTSVPETNFVADNVASDITSRLAKIEADHDINIIYALESGSRAWGFPSPDSDYDIRFVYVNKPEAYFGVLGEQQTISFMDNNRDFDFVGWDARKAVKLMHSGNSQIIEWMQSPITYLKTDIGLELKELAFKSFDPYNAWYSFYNLGKNTFKEHLQKDVINLKKYFYAARSFLCCMWIEEHLAIPPFTFKELVETSDYTKNNPAFLAALLDVYNLKISSSEKHTSSAVSALHVPLAEFFGTRQDFCRPVNGDKAKLTKKQIDAAVADRAVPYNSFLTKAILKI